VKLHFLAAVLLALGMVGPAQAAQSCGPGEVPVFSFGFAELKRQLGPVMGDPLECERFEVATGDTQQSTTTGLSFYRARTNTPTFTDGYRHWALTSAGLVTWEGSSIDPPGSRPRAMLVLGDSLPAGEGASEPSRGYVSQAFASLRATGDVDELRNFGARTETVGSVLTGSQLRRGLDVLQNGALEVPLILVQAGSNDLLNVLDSEICQLALILGTARCQNLVLAEMARVETRLTDLLGTLRRAAPNARILVLTSYNPASGTANRLAPLVDQALLGVDGRVDCGAARAERGRLGLNDVIGCVAGDLQLELVDIEPTFRGRAPVLTRIGEGDIHPNDLGHTELAAQILRTVRLEGR
jgi:lysophospholipase L1-like esterase